MKCLLKANLYMISHMKAIQLNAFIASKTKIGLLPKDCVLWVYRCLILKQLDLPLTNTFWSPLILHIMTLPSFEAKALTRIFTYKGNNEMRQNKSNRLGSLSSLNIRVKLTSSFLYNLNGIPFVLEDFPLRRYCNTFSSSSVVNGLSKKDCSGTVNCSGMSES